MKKLILLTSILLLASCAKTNTKCEDARLVYTKYWNGHFWDYTPVTVCMKWSE